MTVHRPRLASALVLASALLALLPAVPAAEPEPAPWSPQALAEPVQALALAKDATTLAVGTRALQDRGLPAVGTAPGAPGRSDLSILDAVAGVLFNSSSAPEGKRAVAASADGRAVAAAGPVFGQESLFYYAVKGAVASPNPATPGPGTKAADWTISMPGTVADIALSGDGSRIAVAANAAGEGRLLVYTSGQTRALEYAGADRLTSVDVSKDGRWIVAAGKGSATSEGVSVGAVYLFRDSASDPVRRYFVAGDNGTIVRDVRITPDGSAFVALTNGGQVLYFENKGASTRDPVVFGEHRQGANGRAVALSGDGSVVAYAADRSVTALEAGAGALRELWTYAAEGAVTSVDANRTGDVIVAGVTGSAEGAVVALHPSSGTPFWKLGGGTATNVTVTSDGRWVAYAQGANAHARLLRHNLTFLFETAPGTGVPTAPPTSTEPFQAVTFQTLVQNGGSLPARVEIGLPTPRDVTLTSDQRVVDVLPGGSVPVAITVKPGRLTPGDYSLNATARVLGSAHQANLTLAFTITPVSELSVSLTGPSERRVGPGVNDSVLLGVFNTGNGASDVLVEVRQTVSKGAEWPVRIIGENRFTLAPGARSAVHVLVETPKNAINGSTNLVTVSLTTQKGTSSADVLYSVNPFVAVNLTVPGRAKFVHAGHTVQFNVTVENTGSVDANFEASYLPLRISGQSKNWVVQVDPAPFPLGPGESRVVPVRIFAPKDAVEGETGSVTVEVQNIALTPDVNVVSENVTLSATVQTPLPPPPSPNARVPAAGAPLVLAALAVAALVALIPRRRSQ